MLNIDLKQSVYNYSIQFNQENNIGARGHADGNMEEQLVGILGQNIICDTLDLPMMKPSGFDGGVDINLNNKKIDIKTMGRKSYPKLNYVNNLIASQLKYDVDVYLFCSYHKKDNILTVCGWIDKDEFIKKSKFYKKGEERKRFDGTSFNTKADLCEIENKYLNQINNIYELKRVGLPLT